MFLGLNHLSKTDLLQLISNMCKMKTSKLHDLPCVYQYTPHKKSSTRTEFASTLRFISIVIVPHKHRDTFLQHVGLLVIISCSVIR